MNPSPPIQIALSTIDARDETYRITPAWLPSDGALETSIRSAGILTPLRLERVDERRFRIISGFRRFEIARKLDLQSLPAVSFPGPPCLEHFRFAFWEKVGTEALHDLEKAECIGRLVGDFLVPELELLETYLPALQVSSSRYHIKRYQTIAGLPVRLKKACLEDGLLVETAVQIAPWEGSERELILQLVRQHKLGRNKQRQLLELLSEIAHMQQISILAAWKASGLQAPNDDGRLGTAQTFTEIRQELRRLRFPNLSNWESRYAALKKELHLPPEIRLEIPEFFEGDQIQLTLRARSVGELQQLVEKAQSVSQQKETAEIFELL